jgi:hypothetical protein
MKLVTICDDGRGRQLIVVSSNLGQAGIALLFGETGTEAKQPGHDRSDSIGKNRTIGTSFFYFLQCASQTIEHSVPRNANPFIFAA